MISLDQAKYFELKVHSEIAMVDFLASVALVGSTIICGEGEDADILVCTTSPEARIEFENHLQTNRGYVVEGNEDYPQDEFTSMRNPESPEINILVCDDPKFFESWLRAVSACRAVFIATGACDRELRVAIHQAVMD